jgi:hypothetical protein
VSGMADVSVSATDDVAVAYVELRVDGVLVATDTGAPWSLPWNTTTMSEGTHSLVARAVDASGKVGESSAVTCTVSNAADTVAPVVAITSPSTGATVSKTFTVATTATDAGGVSRVELYLDGAKVSTLTAAPYNFTLNPRRWKSGSHTLVAKAYDGAGNAGTSATVTVKR